ncbi:MAG: hypothetical protein LIP02_03980 [Bacteroidales bacterium]|nr:hypothetical protein [Bacteroidales bacterium]
MARKKSIADIDAQVGRIQDLAYELSRRDGLTGARYREIADRNDFAERTGSWYVSNIERLRGKDNPRTGRKTARYDKKYSQNTYMANNQG